MRKRLLSFLLTLCMVLTLMPAAAMAEDSSETVDAMSETSVSVAEATLSALQAGIDSAVSQNIGTVDVTVSVTMNGETGTLDLKGRTIVIQRSSIGKLNDIFLKSSTLTVTDSVGGGTIEAPYYDTQTLSDNTQYYSGSNIFAVNSGSSLTIEAGTYKSACAQFISCGGSDATINGGSFICTGDLNVLDYKRAFTVYNYAIGSSTTTKTSSFTMTAGSVRQVNSSDTQGIYGIVAYDGATVTLGKSSDGTGPSISVGRNPLLTELSQYYEDGNAFDPVNGSFTVYGGTYASTSANLTVGTTEHNGRPSSALAAMNGGNYSISGGTFESAGSYAILASLQPNTDRSSGTIAVPADARAEITVSGGSFKGTSGIYSNTKSDAQSEDNSLSLSGGKFSAKPDDSNIADGYAVIKNSGSDSSTYPYNVVEASQPITVSALQTLIDGTSGNSLAVNSFVEAEGSDTLDLKGKTITFGKNSEEKSCAIIVPEGKSLDVKGNGTILSNEDGETVEGQPNNYISGQLFDVEVGAKLTIENGTYQTAFGGFINAFGADIVIDDCTYISTADFSKHDCSSFIDLNAGGGYSGYARRGSTLTMTAGSLSEQTPSASYGMFGIIAYDGSTVTLGSESGHTGPAITVGRTPVITLLSLYHKTADTVNGTFTVYGGTYKSTLAGQTGSYPFSAMSFLNGGDYLISGGTFESASQPAVTAALEPAGSTAIPADARAAVTITGGSFKGASGSDIIKSVKHSTQTADNAVSVSGGKFSAKPGSSYIAEGYEAVSNGDSDSSIYPYLVQAPKTPVTISGLSISDKTYDGTAAALSGTALVKTTAGNTDVTSSCGTLVCRYTSTDGGTYDSMSAPKNAGSYKLIVSVPSDNDTYAGSAEITFTISKAAPVCTAPKNLIAVYGNTLADVDISSGTGDGTWSWVKAVTTPVGNAGANMFSMVFTPKDTANYSTITDAGVTVQVAKAQNEGYGTAQSKEYLVDRASAGQSKYKLPCTELEGVSWHVDSYSHNHILTEAEPSVSGGEITFTTTDTAALNETDTIVITVTSTNYQDIALTLTVTAADMPRVEITTSPAGAFYNTGDSAAALTVSASAEDSGTLSYQWYSSSTDSTENGTPIDGALAESYTPSTLRAGTVYYYCIVTDTLGTLTADAASTAAKVKVTDFLFQDTQEGAWYMTAVAYVNAHGLMTGKDPTTFAPSEYLVRGQFATILYRIEGTPDVTYFPQFPDVQNNGAFYVKPALWAYQAGVISGYQNGNFGPADKINREQMATMMYRFANYKGYKPEANGDISAYPDASNVSGFAAEAMKWAVGNGIISGDNGKLNPQGTANRAVCAMIIMRFMQKYGE